MTRFALALVVFSALAAFSLPGMACDAIEKGAAPAKRLKARVAAASSMWEAPEAVYESASAVWTRPAAR